MLRKLQQNFQKIPGWQNKKYLLAVSGGIDSMVLADILLKLELRFELAHCNFKLRGPESDADQEFVEKYASEHQIPVHIKVCTISDTENIQIAARNARYQWFDSLVDHYGFDYILTAHHLDDSIETFFINLLRATGLKGLSGIVNHHKLFRPLSDISREEIVKYATQNHLSWREDSSNLSDKYRRNFIRHHIIPELKKLQPGFYKSFSKTFTYLQQSQSVIDEWFETVKNRVVIKENAVLKLDLKQFDTVIQKDLFLYQWLSLYGFSDMEGINRLLTGQTGKEIFSKEFRLTKHGDFLLLQKSGPVDVQTYKLDKHTKEINEPLPLKLEIIDRNELNEEVFKTAGLHEIYIDYALIKFPLILRKWQPGDYFYPFGMSGKKKLSDYFTDIKLSKPDKEKIWLLCNGVDVVWVIGKRMDERYKITSKTKKILHLRLI